jgi:hypothetical protein
MSFRCVRVRDMTQRNRLEEALIATLAACEECVPTSAWLGNHCYSESVRRFGLWNSEYVNGDPISAAELDTFEKCVQASIPTQSSDLRSTLLIIPCCSSKNGARDPGLQEVSVVHRIDSDLAKRVSEGRNEAFHCQGTYLDSASELRPALAWYTGQPYETAGVRDLLTNAIRDGLHCLIVSGGYGVLMAQEPIHWYGAHLQRTKKVWRRIIPQVISDYVARNGIRRTFTVVSSGYAEVIPVQLSGNDWRAVPSFDPGQDSGSAMRVVPAKVGALLRNLLLSDFEPTDEWARS